MGSEVEIKKMPSRENLVIQDANAIATIFNMLVPPLNLFEGNHEPI